MADPFPDYDVLAKRDTPSWNDRTRNVIDTRLSLPERRDCLTETQHATLIAIADRIVPQPEGRQAVNTVAIVLKKIAANAGDGYRHARLPDVRDAWLQALDALDREAQVRHDRRLASLDREIIDRLLRCVERGEVAADWGGLDPQLFWKWRLIPDLVSAYYAHPSAWSAMGFGGPASPRGYVRMDANQRDPWEAAERGDDNLLPASFRNRHAG